jgi:hypothetical protein
MDYAISLQCVWFAVHLLGLSTAFLLRIYSGSRVELLLQALYLCELGAVAAAALAGRHFCWELSTLSSGALAVMIVAAVLEVGPRREVPSAVHSA